MISKADFETNVLYMMSLAMDLIARDCQRRTVEEGGCWKYEKKRLFNRYRDAVKQACILQEELTQDIYMVDAKNKYRNVEIWQEEANELARLMLLYADRCTDVETVEKVHAFLRELPSEGICDENMLERFYLKKL